MTGNAQVPQNPTIAGELGHPHVGAWISWEIPSPNLLLPVRIPPREIAWLAFDGHKINIGLWPAAATRALAGRPGGSPRRDSPP